MMSTELSDQMVYLNGNFKPLSQAHISVLDRGFIFGDGVYEVIPVYGRTPFHLSAHLQRLDDSMRGLQLRNPHTVEEWQAIIHQLIAAQPFANQAVYLQVTRGVAAKRDHVLPTEYTPTVFLMSNPLPSPTPQQREQGVTIISAEDTRWAHCHLKTTALLGNVLLRQLSAEVNATETILFRNGYLTEGSSTNVFVVKAGTIYTAPASNLILPGISAQVVIDLAQTHHIPLVFKSLSRREVIEADEIWITSSTKEVLAATTLDGQPVGDGRVGVMFQQVRTLFDACLV
jgi:D-alanine transaminase